LLGNLFGEIIPQDRRITWNPGILGGIPEVVEKANVKDFGAQGNGSSDDAQAFKDAINAAKNAGGGAVLIPAGTYRINSTISLSSNVVLRGEGYDKTHLDINTSGDAISISGGSKGSLVNVTGGYKKGSTSLTVSTAASFSAGDFAEIQQDNDASLMYTQSSWNTSWGSKCCGPDI